MSRCKNCGKRMQYRRDFCSENCADEYFEVHEPIEVEEIEEENDD